MPLTRRSLFVGLGAVLAAGAGTTFYLTRHPEGGDTAFYSVDGIAIRGTDAVAYFTEGRPVAGDAAYSHDWSGSTWHFASAENRDAFAADPTAYAPQYGGYCAWAVAAKGQLFSTQPSNWAVVDGKLYLNFNDRVQETWNTDVPGFIEEGDRRWPDVQQRIG
ncbi:YHS domain-containing (seleno)protein [Pseudaestuariivita sp.]|uniref:YHS domain-containing (seleno)protein n=1 Tax=Pseudaestuariivita sp. TaxID=2211669 RepID=UPI0040587789